MAGTPRYDPELAAKDADYFFGLYPRYGYGGIAIPLLFGYPYGRSAKTSANGSDG